VCSATLPAISASNWRLASSASARLMAASAMEDRFRPADCARVTRSLFRLMFTARRGALLS
jgi:hypothetical protein